MAPVSVTREVKIYIFLITLHNFNKVLFILSICAVPKKKIPEKMSDISEISTMSAMGEYELETSFHQL